MTEQRPLNTSPLRVSLRVEDYLLLDRSGAFKDYARTELIEGTIVYMNAQHRPHARIKSRLFLAIAATLKTAGSNLEALVEASIAVPPINVPEPDILLTNMAAGDGLVPLDSVALVIEVSDSTLDTDLGQKRALYARIGIPEYWVVDVNARRICQMWEPTRDGYISVRNYPFGETITAAIVADLTVGTDGL